MTESKIVADIRKALAPRVCFVIKLHGGPMQRAGLPDLLVIYQGRAIFLEVKQPGEPATRIQEHTMAKLREAGAVTAVVTSVAEAESVVFGETTGS